MVDVEVVRTDNNNLSSLASESCSVCDVRAVQYETKERTAKPAGVARKECWSRT